jgi:hypothetical protein
MQSLKPVALSEIPWNTQCNAPGFIMQKEGNSLLLIFFLRVVIILVEIVGDCYIYVIIKTVKLLDEIN